MGHVHYQKTNNVGSGPLRYTIWHFPLQAGRICLTHTRSLLIRIFAILMKVNWQLSNKSIRWPSSPECIASSLFYSLRSSIFYAFRWYFIWSRALFCILREAPLLKKYIHPRKFGQQVTVHRPPDLPSVRTTDIPMFHFTLSSKFGSLQPNCTSMFWSIDSCQNSVSAD